MRRRPRTAAALLAAAAFSASLALAAAQQQDREPGPRERPEPDRADVPYGPHERHVLDYWAAESEGPAPLVVFIHGGGFRGGDKAAVPTPLLRGCLDRGIAVASISYRLSQHAPFPAPMEDGARAIQFLRSVADDWGIDPDRIAASGGSAGAGISLWVAFHDDLADPDADDPVARESSRLACVAVRGAQTTYDPRVIAAIVGGRAHEHPALQPFFGLGDDELDSERAFALYEAASPDQYVSADDPPVFLLYNEPPGPLPPDAPPGRGIHHPNFGHYLKPKLEKLGIECVVRHGDDIEGGPAADEAELVDFLARHLKAEGGPS